MSGRVRMSVGVLLVGLGLAGCHGGSLKSGEARLSVDGDTQVAFGSKAFKSVQGTKTLHGGDRVRVDSGSARIALSGGGHLELRQGSQMRYAAVPFVEAGDLLVEPGRQATEVATDGATVRVLDGAAHLSRTLAFAVTAYRGTTTITSPGSAPLAVRAPRQATLPARGVLPDHADPADYHTDDGWDRRFLGVPVEVGNQLETGASGFMQQLPAGEGTTAGFFRRVVPSLAAQPALDEVVNPSYGAADNLVGALIVQRSQRGGFTQRWRDVFDFRDPGGRQVNWGLVALDQGINDPTVLTHDLDDAIGRAPKQFALAAGIGSGSSSDSLAGSSADLGGGSSGGGNGSGSGNGSGGSSGGSSNTPPTSATTQPPSPGSPTTTTIPSPITGPLPSVPLPTVPLPSIPLPTTPAPSGSTTTLPRTTVPPTTLPPTPKTSTPVDSVVDPVVGTVETTGSSLLPVLPTLPPLPGR